jgi:hypothetical protein
MVVWGCFAPDKWENCDALFAVIGDVPVKQGKV